MSRVTRRPHAEADILEIWGYIAEDSVVAADRWVDKLDEKFAQLVASTAHHRLRRPQCKLLIELVDPTISRNNAVFGDVSPNLQDVCLDRKSVV